MNNLPFDIIEQILNNLDNRSIASLCSAISYVKSFFSHVRSKHLLKYKLKDNCVISIKNCTITTLINLFTMPLKKRLLLTQQYTLALKNNGDLYVACDSTNSYLHLCPWKSSSFQLIEQNVMQISSDLAQYRYSYGNNLYILFKNGIVNAFRVNYNDKISYPDVENITHLQYSLALSKNNTLYDLSNKSFIKINDYKAMYPFPNGYSLGTSGQLYHNQVQIIIKVGVSIIKIIPTEDRDYFHDVKGVVYCVDPGYRKGMIRGNWKFYQLCTNIIQIESCPTHTLFLTTSGIVYGTGANDDAEFGFLDNLPMLPRKDIIILPNLYNIVEIAVVEKTSMFINNKGELYVCGSNTYGRLGLGCVDYKAIIDKPTKVPDFDWS